MSPQQPEVTRHAAAIYVLRIDPASINDDGSYLIACPKGTKVLSVGVFDETNMVVWMAVPVFGHESNARLWILPGGKPGPAGLVEDCDFVGTAIIVDKLNSTMQDWHVFAERGAYFGAVTKPNATVFH